MRYCGNYAGCDNPECECNAVPFWLCAVVGGIVAGLLEVAMWLLWGVVIMSVCARCK